MLRRKSGKGSCAGFTNGDSRPTLGLVNRGVAGTRGQTEARSPGAFPAGLGADFAALLRKQYDDFGRAIREANIKAD